MARSKKSTQTDLDVKAAYAAEWNAAKQAARAAIMSQPMPLVASDSDPSAAYGRVSVLDTLFSPCSRTMARRRRTLCGFAPLAHFCQTGSMPRGGWA